MGKRYPKSKLPPGLTFAAMYEWEMALPAWRMMSAHGRCLVLELRRKYNTRNNGEIVMSVREAAELLHCNKDTAHRALREVQAKGWAIPTQMGHFDQKTNKTATTWRITNQPIGLGLDTPETKEYARWQPEPKKQNAVPKFRTACPTDGDRCGKNGPKISDRTPPNCPTDGDRDPPKTPPDGPKIPDTSNISHTREGNVRANPKGGAHVPDRDGFQKIGDVVRANLNGAERV